MRLRPYRQTDAENIAKWIANERSHALWCANLLPYRFNQEEFQQKLAEDEIKLNQDSFVATDDEGRPLGHFAISINHNKNSGYMKFIIVDSAKRGNGYGREMMKMAVHYAFTSLNLETVRLAVFDVNEAAVRAYRAAGFSEVEFLPDAFEFQKEKWGRRIMEIAR